MVFGLMGVKNDGKTLVSPKGTRLISVPSWLAICIQRIQHKISALSHKGWFKWF